MKINFLPAMILLTGVAGYTCCTRNETATAPTATTTDLHHYFSELSKVPNMKALAPGDSISFSTDAFTLDDMVIVGATGLKQAATLQTGNAMYGVLNHIDLTKMINGGNNNLVSAFVYASPIADDSGRYELLVVTADGYEGDFVTVYGTTDSATVSMIQTAPMVMQGSNLDISLAQTPHETINLINI